MQSDFLKRFAHRVDQLSLTPEERHSLLQFVREEHDRGYQQGDMDSKGNTILVLVSIEDLYGNPKAGREGVVPDGYKLATRNTSGFITQAEEFQQAVRNVDPENYREAYTNDLAECFVQQVLDPRTAEEGIWDSMPKTKQFIKDATTEAFYNLPLSEAEALMLALHIEPDHEQMASFYRLARQENQATLEPRAEHDPYGDGRDYDVS